MLFDPGEACYSHTSVRPGPSVSHDSGQTPLRSGLRPRLRVEAADTARPRWTDVRPEAQAAGRPRPEPKMKCATETRHVALTAAKRLQLNRCNHQHKTVEHKNTSKQSQNFAYWWCLWVYFASFRALLNSSYPIVLSLLLKTLRLKWCALLPLSPTPHCRRALGHPLVSCERTKQRGRANGENWNWA